MDGREWEKMRRVYVGAERKEGGRERGGSVPPFFIVQFKHCQGRRVVSQAGRCMVE